MVILQGQEYERQAQKPILTKWQS
ncbi:hypothetical protein CFP56_012150 [Quercus suber]|uniref:Uncharacterized protein n=1 Tax=Quercus suber TaxID=58331 RepID=A0AAW0KY11_QUESU